MRPGPERRPQELRKLTAIVVADVVGYSRLMGADEAGTLDAMRRHQRELIGPMIAAFHGRLIKTTGDGLLLEFASIIDACRFAIALQQGMAARNEPIDEARRLRFRVGVNIGDIIVEDGDIFGDGVNVAARLEQLAEAGALCISRAAWEQIRSTTDAPFVDLGAHTVKNIARPIEVYALSATAIAALPPVAVTPMAAPRKWRRTTVAAWGLGAVAAIALAILGVVLIRNRPVDLNAGLDAALAKAIPDSTADDRRKAIATFLATSMHRSLLFAPTAKSRWFTGDWPTRELAVEKGLERCQVNNGEPCALLAADEDLIAAGADGSWPGVDMPRTHYAGPFRPDWIPGIRASTIKRADVEDYGMASAPKAVAYHPRGLLVVVTGATSRNEAEAKALDMCNTTRKRQNSASPCLLYAVDNRVVLPERRIAPSTAPP